MYKTTQALNATHWDGDGTLVRGLMIQLVRRRAKKEALLRLYVYSLAAGLFRESALFHLLQVLPPCR
jgi:hypothetical protein